MPVLVGSNPRVVVTDSDRSTSLVKQRNTATQVTDRRTVGELQDGLETVEVSSPGVQGPRGTTNIPDTDALPEGVANLYYTTQRAADAFDSAMGAVVEAGAHQGAAVTYDAELHALTVVNTDRGSTARALHESQLDPHPQYLADGDVIDGGNF